MQPRGRFGPTEQELRVRAAIRVARRRTFMTSAAFLGTLILLNLYFYSQTHNSMWLLLDLAFTLTLSYRAWWAFGSMAKDDLRVQREMTRMRMADRGSPEDPSRGPSGSWTVSSWTDPPSPPGGGFRP